MTLNDLVKTLGESHGTYLGVKPILPNEALEGIWFDRTKEYAARRRGEDFEDLTSPTLLSYRPPFLREKRETAAWRVGGGALSRGKGGRWERVGVRFSGRGRRLPK